MNRLRSLLFVGGLTASLVGGFTERMSAKQPAFEFQDGDRVVLLGGTFVEREVRYGYLETALTAAVPQRQVIFRNLGWSGDTVWAESRGIFDPPQIGYQRMLELVKELKPTVLIFAYGANESFAGDQGLAPFIQQYEKLLNDLAPLNCRSVFLTPHQLEKPEPPLPDASRQNPMLGRYAQAIRELAARRKGWLVDLYDRTGAVVMKPETTSPKTAVAPEPPRGFHQVDREWHSLPLTENGIHLSAYGYLRVARMIVQQLQLAPPEFLIQLGSMGDPESLKHATVADFHSDGQQVRFQVTLTRLPEPPTPLFPRDAEFFLVSGGGLPSGNYELKVDGEVAAVNPTILVGFPVREGPDYQQAEKLRRKVVDKNLLFFYRWRPQNITYLTGFRKHEQGNNAVEIAQFDPLVEKIELEIAELKKPVPRKYEIVPRVVEEKKK